MPSPRQRIEAGVVRALIALPRPAARLLAGRPIRIDGQELDPHVQIALRLERMAGGFEPAPVEEVRARRRRDADTFRGPVIEVARVSELEIPGPAGAIPARLYIPAGVVDGAPLIVYYHGGGHVICDLDTHDQPCRFLAAEVGALVLSVDYRLGPEHPFPAAVDDSVAAFEWAAGEAAGLGADPGRIALAGDSAGGNLAAVVAQLATASEGAKPAFQALIYPVTDYSSKRPSYETFAEGFFLTRAEMDWFRDNYFADPADREDPRASPILAADLAGVAPAHVVTAGFDPLRDEGEAYAEALRAAGVEVTAKREPDLVHGFINAVGLGGRSREALGAIAAALRVGLAAPAPARVDY
ncbi:MAG: acetyl esterase [Solirubrobacterales bacterium]|jgi:acetyl esterase|nr:acetyl esterase [Solirubrobacterales bacterium]